MIESEASVKGRVVAEMLSHFTNDLKIGKKIKSGELRKRMIEPPWIPPAMFNLTGINMDHFTMKLLSLKENPNTDYVILQLHGGGYTGAVRNAYYVFAGLYNELSHGCNVLTPDYRVAPENPYPAALEDALHHTAGCFPRDIMENRLSLPEIRQAVDWRWHSVCICGIIICRYREES